MSLIQGLLEVVTRNRGPKPYLQDSEAVLECLSTRGLQGRSGLVQQGPMVDSPILHRDAAHDR